MEANSELDYLARVDRGGLSVPSVFTKTASRYCYFLNSIRTRSKRKQILVCNYRAQGCTLVVVGRVSFLVVFSSVPRVPPWLLLCTSRFSQTAGICRYQHFSQWLSKEKKGLVAYVKKIASKCVPQSDFKKQKQFLDGWLT